MDNNQLSEPAGRNISKLHPAQEDDYSSSVRKKLSGSSRTGQACDRCKVSPVSYLNTLVRLPFEPVPCTSTLAASANHYDMRQCWCDTANTCLSRTKTALAGSWLGYIIRRSKPIPPPSHLKPLPLLYSKCLILFTYIFILIQL